jgi:hypothetical protein
MQIRARSRKRNRIIGIVLLAASALTAVYVLWPTSYRTETFSVRSDLLPQAFQLTVRYPRFGPSGEPVTIEADWQPEGEAAAFAKPGESNPILVAEIQSPEIDVEPEGQSSTPLQQGKPAHFEWQALASSSGDGRFNMFFYRAGVEQSGGVYIQQPVWARTFPYQTFPGPGSMKYPMLFLAVFGAIFGAGFLIRNSLH